MDIADIVLSRPDAAIVVENYETSDGHGHDYQRYLDHAATGGRSAAVVLLCQRRDVNLMRDGWEQAIPVTYADVLSDLVAHVERDRAWRDAHPGQHFFVRQLEHQFLEGHSHVDTADQIAFIRAMCETGQSARYGSRPIDRATQEFADLVAEQARRQFEDSRKTLAAVKDGLRAFARTILVAQVNASLTHGRIERVVTRFVGQWEWCVELQRRDDEPTVFLEFGPTAVVQNQRAPVPLGEPDYSRVFATIYDRVEDNIARIAQTDVTLAEAIDGLPVGDVRLRDALLAIIEPDR